MAYLLFNKKNKIKPKHQVFIKNVKGEKHEKHILHNNTNLLSKQQIDTWQLLHNSCM